jgi:excisionase family DNA binding protein
MTSFDFRKSIEAALAALDSFDAAIRCFREALTALLASIETTASKIDTQELLSVSEVARKFHVSRRTVLEARRKGHLRGMKPGGSSLILFELAVVEEWVQGRSGRLRVVR